jgi:predicted nucleic acid-binding protein
MDIVMGTNVFVSGLRSGGGASREVIGQALLGRHRPLFANALLLEFEDVLGRDIWTTQTTAEERRQVLAALARSGRRVTLHYGWRPSLPDEKDNHLVELAVAGSAAVIVTHNVSDLSRCELVFKQVRIMTPAQILEHIK